MLATFLSAAFAQSQQVQVMLLDLRSGKVEQLTHLSSGNAANPAFTHNGKYVTYEIYNRPSLDPPFDLEPITFGIVDVKNKNETDLCEFLGFECLEDDPFAGANDGRWSPNGNYLLFDGLNKLQSDPPTFDPSLYYLTSDPLTSNLPTGEIQTLLEAKFDQEEGRPLEGYIFADWSQDSEKVVFTHLGFEFFYTVSVSTFNIETEKITTVFEGTPLPLDPEVGTYTQERGYNATWSPNGQYIAYVFQKVKVEVEMKMDDEGNWEKIITETVLESNIRKIRVDDDGEPISDPVPLTADLEGKDIINEQPSWSNDSKTIVFQSNRPTDGENLEDYVPDYNLWTIPANGGDEPTLLLDESDTADTDEWDPAFSKNGRWIVYVAPPIE